MQGRLTKKTCDYLKEFKDNIREKSCQLGLNKNEQMTQLLQFVYDYEPLIFTKEDFQKRKRVKNVVPFFDRCSAKKSSNEQCTRRRKEDQEFCGTHQEKKPHGVISSQLECKPCTQKIEVWAQDIKGIIYHLDKNGNVYQQEDVIANKMNPKIIAKYVKIGEQYSIPELGI